MGPRTATRIAIFATVVFSLSTIAAAWDAFSDTRWRFANAAMAEEYVDDGDDDRSAVWARRAEQHRAWAWRTAGVGTLGLLSDATLVMGLLVFLVPLNRRQKQAGGQT